MHPRMNLGAGTIYASDGEFYKEVASFTGGVIAVEEIEAAADALSQQFQNVQTTLALSPTYKKWFKKKKGNRYILYHKTINGFNPKIFDWLLGGE